MLKRALLIIAVLVTVGIAFYIARKTSEPATQLDAASAMEATGARYERSQVMTQSEYVKMRTIADQMTKTGAVSDPDLDYLIRQCQDPRSASTSPGRVHEWAAVGFTSLRTYGPGQKEKIAEACMPLLKSNLGLDQRISLDVFAHLRDARAVSLALPLLNSPDEHVKKDARKYLMAVGYDPER